MPDCENCKGQVLPDATFCEACGHKLGTPAARKPEPGEAKPGSLRSELAFLSGSIDQAKVRIDPRRQEITAELMRKNDTDTLTFDLSTASNNDSDLTHALLEAAAEVRGLAPLLIAQGLPSPDFHPIAQVAGFSHASQRASGVIDEKEAIAA